MSDIFTICREGDEEGVRSMIAADKGVVHARNPSWVSCPFSEINCCINIISSMSIIISSHISIIYSTIGLLCTGLQRTVIQPPHSSFCKQGLM